MRLLIFIIAAACGLPAHADAPPAPTPAKSSTCIACHGPLGISANDLWPNLAGQKSQYIIKQLKAFRDGERADPLMSAIAKMLSDQDIQEFAAYFSRLKGAQ